MSGANVILEAFTNIGITILAIGLAALCAYILGVVLRLLFVDKDEALENASGSQSIRAFFKGQLSSRAEPPMGDMRTKEGMVYDENKKVVIPIRTLSYEAIRRGFGL